MDGQVQPSEPRSSSLAHSAWCSSSDGLNPLESLKGRDGWLWCRCCSFDVFPWLVFCKYFSHVLETLMVFEITLMDDQLSDTSPAERRIMKLVMIQVCLSIAVTRLSVACGSESIYPDSSYPPVSSMQCNLRQARRMVPSSCSRIKK